MEGFEVVRGVEAAVDPAAVLSSRRESSSASASVPTTSSCWASSPRVAALFRFELPAAFVSAAVLGCGVATELRVVRVLARDRVDAPLFRVPSSLSSTVLALVAVATGRVALALVLVTARPGGSRKDGDEERSGSKRLANILAPYSRRGRENGRKAAFLRSALSSSGSKMASSLASMVSRSYSVRSLRQMPGTLVCGAVSGV